MSEDLPSIVSLSYADLKAVCPMVCVQDALACLSAAYCSQCGHNGTRQAIELDGFVLGDTLGWTGFGLVIAAGLLLDLVGLFVNGLILGAAGAARDVSGFEYRGNGTFSRRRVAMSPPPP